MPKTADADGDGLVNPADVAPFVGVVLGGSANPDDLCAAGANLDGIVNGADVANASPAF